MIRFKVTFDKDAEQDWLNDMCQKGWAFVNFCAGICTFVPCQPGEYIYQIDLLDGDGAHPRDPEGYREFMEDTGVEVVRRWFRWVYLRKKASDGPFEIYTDTASKISMYRRIRSLFIWALVVELCCFASFFGSGAISNWAHIIWRIIVGVWIVMLAAITRAIIRSSRIIRRLENNKN